jgi:glycosyltransferase involved in cell wall biosynthesis
MKLSSIVIAKNEEKNISRCIKSQLPCIDEIVVLIDKDSNDNTLEIVKSFDKVKYEIVEWMGYAKTKQYAVELTSNDWILWIDADEAITNNLATELNEFKKNTYQQNAFSIPRKAYFLGKWIKHSGWYPGRVVRLFNKIKARFNNNDVHEELIFEGKSGDLKNDLEHYTDPNIFHYFEKFNRYTSLASNELSENGRTFSLIDLLMRPLFIFIKMFFLKKGFLDGIHGFILAVFSSLYVFAKYAKLWELNLPTGRQD